MTKSQAIQVLEEMAVLLELKGENVFRVRAFQNAARALETDSRELAELIDTGELENIKGIGKGISYVLHDLCHHGKSRDHESLRKEFPQTLFELFKISGLGPKRIKILYEKLKIKSVQDLEKACRASKLLTLDGFGEKIQGSILKGIAQIQQNAGIFRLDRALEEAVKLRDFLLKQKAVLKVEWAGSLRRMKETIGDVDLLAAVSKNAGVHEAFAKYPEILRVLAQGETKSSVLLKDGMQADLRTVSEKEFPYALQYFTGSKEHNVALRTIAKKKNYKMNEYGLFKGGRLIPCRTEDEIYKKLGFHSIPPEVRESTGELEWAAKKPFPKLVEEKDIRGVFHVHSTYSDGHASLEAMIAETERLGYEYVGISDHSQSAAYANGLKEDRVREQWKQIDQLQKKFKIRIFKGIESDILADGSLDYPETILKEFDFVIGSIHSRFKMDQEKMTERVLRAMDNKYMTFVGHPTGRLLLEREPFQMDMTRFLDFAKQSGVVVEMNANPHRLDLDWHYARTAKEKGVLLGIHPDAHDLGGLQDVRYGVGIARKAWLAADDILNTQPLTRIEKFLKQRK